MGMILMSASYICLGIFASSISSNQIIAFLFALFIGIFFHFIFDFLEASFTGFLSEIFNYLSIRTHFESVSRGVIDSKDIIYFLSIALLGLISSEAVLAKRNIME